MKDYYWKKIWKQFSSHYLGVIALGIVLLFCLVGIYAPLLASSKPLIIQWNGQWFFPLFRYLFYSGFYTKLVDIFFNIMMFTFPFMVVALWFGKKRAFLLVSIIQIGAFIYLIVNPVKDPSSDPLLSHKKREALVQLRSKGVPKTWKFELDYMNDYAKLKVLLRNQSRLEQHSRIMDHAEKEKLDSVSTLWAVENAHFIESVKRKEKKINTLTPGTPRYKKVAASLQYSIDKQDWLDTESDRFRWQMMPLLRPFHWEDDAGGQQSMNQFLPWWELTRINRKDLMAALIFGVRISLVVGILAVSLAMLVGIPIGSMAGFYGGKLDIFVCRWLEVWESMPTFFMLLLVVAITQSKSIFIVIAVVGIFGWTGFSRYIRGEFFKQRNLPYVEACHALGFRDRRIIFSHILPNAIPPILTLLPFAIMGAITSEAGLSFLGLGEEGSCSWGVLMDEGRAAFPGESYLLWPPAMLLTLLLVSIALVGDALRDAIDPKMQK